MMREPYHRKGDGWVAGVAGRPPAGGEEARRGLADDAARADRARPAARAPRGPTRPGDRPRRSRWRRRATRSVRRSGRRRRAGAGTTGGRRRWARVARRRARFPPLRRHLPLPGRNRSLDGAAPRDDEHRAVLHPRPRRTTSNRPTAAAIGRQVRLRERRGEGRGSGLSQPPLSPGRHRTIPGVSTCDTRRVMLWCVSGDVLVPDGQLRRCRPRCGGRKSVHPDRLPGVTLCHGGQTLADDGETANGAVGGMGPSPGTAESTTGGALRLRSAMARTDDDRPRWCRRGRGTRHEARPSE